MRRFQITISKTVAAGILALVLGALPAPAAKAECQGKDGGSSLVTGIDGGETLILEDGRAVRLIGVMGPRRARSGPASDARAKMEAALKALTLGKKVALDLGERLRDRYGRVLAHVAVLDKGEAPIWIQEELVRAGLVRVISFKDNRLCIDALLAAEENARRAQKGLWETGFFAVRPAEAEDLLFRLENSYEIVEGRVSNVAEIKGRTYINFGRNWRRDFTAFIPAKSGKLFRQTARNAAQTGSSLADLNGKKVRIRGWLKNYNGPSITVTHPEQIEVVNDKAAMVR